MRQWAIIFLFAAAAPALAVPDDAAAVLEQQRQHGFVQPAAAIAALTGAGEGMDKAPLALRMRYHAALASLYAVAEQPEKFKPELAELARMAAEEHCTPCGQYKLVRESQMALRMQDIPAARALLLELEAINVADPALQLALTYARAATYGAAGSQTRSIEEGIKALDLATKTGSFADQVRALNLIMLANIGRRDLATAEKQAEEAYALAERIGFVYMMAYIRNNQGWLYGLKNEPEKQLSALRDALAITRNNPGMADTELTILVNLAEHYLGRKDYGQAIALANQAVKLAET